MIRIRRTPPRRRCQAPLTALLWLCALTGPALAAPEPPAEPDDGPVIAASLGVGLRLHTTGAIDLAGLAGSQDFGSGDDATPAALGLTLSFGLLIDDWELVAEAAVAIGGLDLAQVEERYFDSEPQPIGGTSTAYLMGSVRYLWRLAVDAELAAGLGAGYVPMGASSPVGGGFFRAIAMGPEAEIRWRIHGDDAGEPGGGGGWLGLGVDARLLLPVVAEARSQGEPLFSLDGIGDPIGLGGVTVAYRFDWR